MSTEDRLAGLERRVAELEQFQADVKMNVLADWMEANQDAIRHCLATGEPITLPASGGVITAEELRPAAEAARFERGGADGALPAGA